MNEKQTDVVLPTVDPVGGSSSLLLENLVRALQYGWRDCQTKRLGGLEVDDEFEFRGLLDGKIGRFAALRILSTYVADRCNAAGVMATTALAEDLMNPARARLLVTVAGPCSAQREIACLNDGENFITITANGATAPSGWEAWRPVRNGFAIASSRDRKRAGEVYKLFRSE